MEALTQVLCTLNESEHEQLGKLVKDDTALGRLLQAYRSGKTEDEEELRKKLDVSVPMLNKLETQALEKVYRSIMLCQNNAYDDIILVRTLLYRGLSKQAKKLAVKLEKNYAADNLYSVLDVLYHEALRVAYHLGDTAWMKELVEKSIANAEKHAAYNRLDKTLILNMYRVEQRDIAKKEEASFLSQMAKLETEARKFPQAVLTVNTYYILQLYHINKHDIPAAAKAIKKLRDYIDGDNIPSTDKYALTISPLIVLYFYCRFDIGIEPDTDRKDLEALLGHGGVLELAEFHFNIFRYSFFRNNRQDAVKKHKLIQQLNADTRFAIFKTVSNAYFAFEVKDMKAFRNHLSEFYEQNYMAFREYEIDLRFMEILLLLKEKDLAGAESRTESLRKFIERSGAAVPPEESQLLKILKKLSRTGYLPSGEEPVFYQRSMKYFLEYINTNFRRPN